MVDKNSKNVLVTGANGYIGNAVARAFVRAGWTTYGLIRNPRAVALLAAQEIIPLRGSPASPTFIPSLAAENIVFSVIVSTTEQHPDYISHYNDVITLLRTLAIASNAAGIRPLVIFTSGCKDYGSMPLLSDTQTLTPHTEEIPLNAPPFAVSRAAYSIKTFENNDVFDTIVLRPTSVYGLSGSYYGTFFKTAAEAVQKGTALEITENPNTMLHALHVDDCGEAYVALAEHPDRDVVKRQVFNISSHRYETLSEIAEKLAEEYGIAGGVKWVQKYDEGEDPALNPERMVMGFSQWVGSEKLRHVTGWKDKRLLFSEGLKQYKGAYEVAAGEGYKALDLASSKKG